MSTIHTRATQLEKFRICKYRYFFEPPLDPSNQNFVFGSHVHKYCEELLSWNLNDEIQTLLLQKRPVKQRAMIINMSDLIANYVQEKELTLITTELSMQVYDDESDVLIEWTMDLLLKDKDWKYIIADIKTAASVRTQEHFQWAKQKIIYPTLFKQLYHQEISAFEYRVVTKTSNPKLSVFRYEVEDDTTEQVLAISKELRNSTESQQWEPTPYNHSCFYCKLKEQCRWYKAL